jgi:putative hydrolases of HD superfamily
MNRLAEQIGFIIAIEALKGVKRRNSPAGLERPENSAEHSWSLAIMATLLAEHADETIDVARVVRMLLIHDVVEIEAGDTFVYDSAARAGQTVREEEAAENLFGSLPQDQHAEFLALWREFEFGGSAEAKFARAVDRLHPLLQNFHTEGRTWRRLAITFAQAVERNHPIERSSRTLWAYTLRLLKEATRRGWLQGPPAKVPAGNTKSRPPGPIAETSLVPPSA